MSMVDWALIILLVLSFASGLINGFIYKLGNLLGFLAGVGLAGGFYDNLARIFGGGAGTEIVCFIILFIIGQKIFGLAFKIINKFLHIVDKIPVLKQFNRLFGAILSLITTVLVIAIVLYFLTKFDIASVYLKDSHLAPFFILIGSGMAIFLPKAVRELKSYI